MEIDSGPVPPPQEYSDYPYPSESSMNFDYLNTLHSGGSGSGSMTARGGPSSSSDSTYAQIDYRSAIDRPFNLNERFVTVLDQLDARVEKFRKDAMGLQEKRDYLLMSIDLIKSNDLLQDMNESERDEISCYISRVNSRLSTVELNVRTVRDQSQEDALSQINELIDAMITLGEPVLSRQRCQLYLNACSDSNQGSSSSLYENASGVDAPVDKKFENALLGCTLDDQKTVKKRLHALMGYLNKQTIRD